MKRILLLGSSYSAMPILANLKRRGAVVTVVGMHSEDPCHRLADKSVFADYSCAEKILDQVNPSDFEYVVPTCNDYSYATGAVLANSFNYPGYDTLETVKLLHRKGQFRHFCGENGIRSPRSHGEVRHPGELKLQLCNYPVIVKPVDSFSGRGAAVAGNDSELWSAIENAIQFSRDGAAVVEEFVCGSLHSYSTFIAGGVQIWGEIVDEFCNEYPFQVDGSTFPSSLPWEIRSGIAKEVQKLVQTLSLADGLLHTQFIVNGLNFWIVECMRRCPGDLFPEHFNLTGMLDYWGSYVAPFIDEPSVVGSNEKQSVWVQRKVVSASLPEDFYGIEVAGVHSRDVYFPLKESGQCLRGAPFDKAGILFRVGEVSARKPERLNVRRLRHEVP